MAKFQPVTVTGLRKVARDAVEVTLAPQAPDRFHFEPGQYLTFSKMFDGVELRRSYSICSGPDEALTVGVRAVEGGAFSNFVNDDLEVGMQLQALPPMGRFTLGAASGCRHILMFAGGSGITPVLGLIRAVLRSMADTRITLVYANRAIQTIMFREEIEDLKNTYLRRLSVIHVLEQDAQEVDLFTGRVTQERCAALIAAGLVDPGADRAYLCGPKPMMEGISAALEQAGMAPEAIFYELFASDQPGRVTLPPAAAAAQSTGQVASLSITLDGATRAVPLPPGESLLGAALQAGIDAPWSCRAGVCSTCRCKVTSGDVEMAVNHALEDDEVARGFVLSCQAYPVSGAVAVDFDH